MRDLPWRRGITPYRVLVAEMMLQQTQVERVKDYFPRWMRRFPSVKALAAAGAAYATKPKQAGRLPASSKQRKALPAAPLGDVLKQWEGLGYYTRVRNLHKAARLIVEQHGGRVPRDFDALCALPGVGRYTAGAVLSIAYNLNYPVLDGNVARVLCRVFAIRRDPSKAPTRKLLWRLAEALIPDGHARDFNQAMMEHGALVCTPRSARCSTCCVRTLCSAYQHGQQDRLPVKVKRPRVLKHDIGVAVIGERGRYLIQQRPDDDRLGGLWEFPGGKREPREPIAACIRRELIEELGIEVEVGEKVCEIDHTYTHYHVTLHVYRCRITRGRPDAHYAQRIAWARPTDFPRYTFPAPNLRIIARLTHGM